MNLILIHPCELNGGRAVRLAGERAEHIRTVLRASPGKTLRIGLLNGPKGSGKVETVDGGTVVLRCDFKEEAPPRPAVDLLLAMPRPKVMKRLWSQIASLGVGRIILTNGEKVERFYFDSHVLEPEFYTGRMMEGLQQAGDTLLPEVRIVKELKPFLEDELDFLFPEPGLRLLADPSGSQDIFSVTESRGARVCLAIGPEGGWTPYELELFTARGFRIFRAGPRILRTDTACMVLLGLISEIQRKGMEP